MASSHRDFILLCTKMCQLISSMEIWEHSLLPKPQSHCDDFQNTLPLWKYPTLEITTYPFEGTDSTYSGKILEFAFTWCDTPTYRHSPSRGRGVTGSD